MEVNAALGVIVISCKPHQVKDLNCGFHQHLIANIIYRTKVFKSEKQCDPVTYSQ